MPLLNRPSKRRGTRLYVVSDFHASDPAWRKLLNAIRLNVYKADAVLYAGDLTGKAMVPVVAAGERYEATLLGQRRVARTEDELAALERDVASLGYYAFRTTKDEVDALGGDQAKLDALFSQEIRARVQDWLALAAERLEGTGVPLVLIPGNDDPYDIDEPLAASQYCTNADGRVVDIPGGLQVVGRRARCQRMRSARRSTRSLIRSGIRGGRSS
jgi:Icc-related predicted phosphoesterase